MPFGAAKMAIGKLPARRQCAKVEKFGGVPYPPEVTNLTPSLPLDRRGQGYSVYRIRELLRCVNVVHR
jgi:hypothetical protein